MSVKTHKTTTTTYRTMNMASPEQTATTYRTLSTASPEPTTTTTTYRTLNVAPSPEPTTTTYRTLRVASPEPQVNTVISASSLPYAVNNGSYDVRYLVPVQQQQQPQYVYLQQPMMQQPMMQQMVQPMVQPMYLQSVQSMPHLSVSSSTHDSDLVYQQRQTLESVSGKSSVFSQSSSPIKSPEPSFEEEVYEEEVDEEEEEEEEVEVEEVEIVNVIQQRPPPLIERTSRIEIKSSPPLIERISRTEVSSSLREAPQPTKLDTRYFGELLAEVYRKNCDIHSCISEHVSKIKGTKMDIDLRVDRDDVEALIPKGATELTKQQMRYLLQTRLTADKSMRLLLSTFSSLREELLHMSEDLRRLEGEKEALERDLAFKVDQAKQYDTLLENVRDNNRQLQSSLKEVTASQRTLETELMSSKTNDSSRDFKMKDLEGRLRALEKENDMLRQKLAGQASGASLQKKTEELSRQYDEQLSSMREEKDREIESLRSQMSRLQTKITSTTTSSTTQSSNERSLQLKISELLSMLDQRQSTITRQETEIKKLLLDRNDSSKNVTKTIITKRYKNQYPILGLLSDDYQVTSPVKEDRTIVIERSGEMRKQE